MVVQGGLLAGPCLLGGDRQRGAKSDPVSWQAAAGRGKPRAPCVWHRLAACAHSHPSGLTCVCKGTEQALKDTGHSGEATWTEKAGLYV